MTNILMIIIAILFIILIIVFTYLALLIQQERTIERESWKEENICKYCQYNKKK